ncbi:MAG: DUF5686 family protein [Saprospiraceae bacterium]
MKIKPLFVLLFFAPLFIHAQIKGIVLNHQGEPLPFVNVMINDSPRDGVTTDLDGRFEISANTDVRALTFSYLGYEKQRIEAKDLYNTSFLQVQLQALAYDIGAIEVIAGENPADRIMERVIANRDRHNPEKLKAYSCETYNKFHFSWLPQQAKLEEKLAQRDSMGKKETRYYQNLQKFSQEAEQHHLFLMESITERQYQRPAQYLEKVTHNKVSGFKEATLVALAAAVQPFAFYEEQVTLFDKDFLNPVSPGSPRQYFFHLEDTLYRGMDTIFVIAFHPRKGKNFNGLEGLLHIHSDGYAIENVRAAPTDDQKLHFLIEQHYEQLAGGQWFPAQLHFVMTLEKYPSPMMGIRATGRSFVDKVSLLDTFPAKTFRSKERVVLAETAMLATDSVWATKRPEPLSPLEASTYVHMDSLGSKHQLDRWWRRGQALSDGRWPLGFVDLSLRRALAFNEFEGFRSGVGLYTSDKISKHFSVGAYAAYGFKDEAWKYGGDLNIFFNKRLDIGMHLLYQKDIQEPGLIAFPLEPNLVGRRLFAQQMNEVEVTSLQLKGEFLPFLDVQLEIGKESWRPFPFKEEQPMTIGDFTPFNATAVSLHMRYAYGQKYIGFLGTKLPDEDTRYPILSLSYSKGIKGLWGGALAYDKLLASIVYKPKVRGLGESQMVIEGGMITGDVPLPYLFYSSGIGRDFQWLSLSRTFQAMDFYEFLSDQFLHFFFRHDFGKLLFRTKWFQPAIAVEHNMALGRLDTSRQLTSDGQLFKTLENPYMEAGLVVDNILRVNYLNVAWIGVGVGGYYRYGAQQLGGAWKENTALRLSVSLDF